MTEGLVILTMHAGSGFTPCHLQLKCALVAGDVKGLSCYGQDIELAGSVGLSLLQMLTNPQPKGSPIHSQKKLVGGQGEQTGRKKHNSPFPFKTPLSAPFRPSSIVGGAFLIVSEKWAGLGTKHCRQQTITKESHGICFLPTTEHGEVKRNESVPLLSHVLHLGLSSLGRS